MSQTVRCNKLDDISSVLCDDCQSALEHPAPDDPTMHIGEIDEEAGEVLQPVQEPIVAPANPLQQEALVQQNHVFPTAHEPALLTQDATLEAEDAAPLLNDKTSEILHNLNTASQHLAAVSASTLHQSLRSPHPPRLTPYQSDEALPLSPYSTLPIPVAPEDEDLHLPDEIEAESSPSISDDKAHNDTWEDDIDPLQARHFPTASEIMRIEEEDVRRAIEAGLMLPAHSLRTTPLVLLKKRVNIPFNRRTILLALFIVAILALLVDSALVSMTFFRNAATDKSLGNKPPSVTVSRPNVHFGETITVSMHNFSPFAQVALTHDTEEPLFGRVSPALVRVKSDGSANIMVTISPDWSSGFHTIKAEDTKTRYTATTSLHIDTGSTRPAHLYLGSTEINLGEDIQGANTIQPLTLQNKGNGIISWSATSDQPWLSLSPNHGIFSDSQRILVGATRANLDPGNYTATITLSSSVDAPQTIAVQMKVRALPLNPGPVEAVSPAVLTFNTVDGEGNVAAQAVVISNPGSEPLYWSIDSDTVSTAISDMQFPYTLTTFDSGANNWLNTGISSGVVLPGKTSTVYVSANSQNLLPGVYMRTLLFETQKGYKALNSPLKVDVTLSIEARCSLSLDPMDLTFTAVSGQNNPTTQSLNMVAGQSCADSTSWNASSSASWLALLPAHGIWHNTTNSTLTVGINTADLRPGLYTDAIMITVPGQSSVSVMVNLTVQQPPSRNAPIISAAPLSLTFSATAGQLNPPPQSVTITNTGGSSLTWNTAVNSSASSWLSALPRSGILFPGQTQQLSVKVNATGLTSGLYAGQIALKGLDDAHNPASGSPQSIAVNFSVLPPCTLTPPTSTQLAFNAIQGQASPSSQTIALTASGNCSWPLKWKTTINNAPSWLNITPASGSFASTGQAATLTIAPNTAGMQTGSYQAAVTIGVTDATGQNLAGLAQSFSVTLSVTVPCTLQVPPTSLSFNTQQGSISKAQNITLSTTGSCLYPLNWKVDTDTSSSSWLKLSASSGIETGGGSAFGITADASQLAVGTYNGTITLTASNTNGTALQSSPVTIPVTLTVTGFTLSGTVTACTDAACTLPIPLAGASIVVINNTSNTIVARTTANATGNYSISNLPSGSYTISVGGTDTQGTSYNGVSTVTLSGNTSVNITASIASIVPAATQVVLPGLTN